MTDPGIIEIVENPAVDIIEIIEGSVDVIELMDAGGTPGPRGEPGAGTGGMLLSVSTADGQYYGITIERPLGETLAFGDLAYSKASEERIWKGDFATVNKMPVVGIIVQGGTIGQIATVLIFGTITKLGWAWSQGVIYASASGQPSQTPASGSEKQGQAIGVPLAANTMLFNPNYTLVEVA